MGTSHDASPLGGGACERLQVSVFGKLSMAYRGATAKTVGRKAQALIGYLLLSDAPEATRDKLVGLLSSESGDRLARGSLRQALRELQAVLRGIAFDHLEARKHTVTIARDRLDIDLWRVIEHAERGQVHPLLRSRSRITDTLLEGLDNVDPSFGPWLRDARARLNQHLVSSLAKALPSDDTSPVSEEAETVAGAIQMLDPANEASARIIIRARWASGDIGTALGVYERLWRHLEKEFDVEPSPETQNLVAKLRLEQPDSAAPVAGADSEASPGKLLGGYDARPSIAVLPFETLGPADERYLGEGIVDDIIQILAGQRELFVISKGSTRRYKDASPDVRAIAGMLGVRYVLHGSVQRSADLLRIHTMLTDAHTAEVLRPRRYEGELSDLFDLQDKIALDTMKFIAPYVREQELRRVMRTRPQNWTAYDLVLQALDLLNRLDYASFSRARGLLQKAIVLDPGYSPALTYAAWWHNIRIAQGWSNDVARDGDEAVRLATAAITLNPNDALGQATYGQVCSLIRKRFPEALQCFDRAIAINPNLAIAWTLKAATLSFTGDGPAAVACALRGLALSPADDDLAFSEHILSQAYYVAGDFPASIEWGQRSASKNARRGSNLRILTASLVAAERMAEAKAEAARLLEVAPSFRLTEWAARTPLQDPTRSGIVARLRLAGLPD